MKEIQIKSRKYPTTIKVSDSDFVAVSAEDWHVSRKTNGEKRIYAMIWNGTKEIKMQILQFVYRRMFPGLDHKLYLLQKNDDQYDYTRHNIVREKEAKIVRKLIERDEDKPAYNELNGNDFCNGLEANMKLRELW